MPVQVIVVYANPFVVTIFVRHGKIARHVQMIVEYALMRPCVETRRVMVLKHVALVQPIVESAHQFVVMGHVKVPTEKIVGLVQAIVGHAPHQILCVAMESVTDWKHVGIVLVIVQVSARALTDKSAIIMRV